jgi:hypothetical protein
MGAVEGGADPFGEFLGGEPARGLHDFALAVRPFGLSEPILLHLL